MSSYLSTGREELQVFMKTPLCDLTLAPYDIRGDITMTTTRSYCDKLVSSPSVCERGRISVLNRKICPFPRAKQLTQRQRQNDKRRHAFCPPPSQKPFDPNATLCLYFTWRWPVVEADTSLSTGQDKAFSSTDSDSYHPFLILA